MWSQGNLVITFVVCALFAEENAFTSGMVQSLVNVAVGKPAKQSSTYIGRAEYGDTDNFEYSASLAVDGNNDTNFRFNSCSHTDAGHSSAWWEVDLGGLYPITKVVIFQRSDAFPERNAGYKVEGKTERDEYSKAWKLTGLNDSIATLDIPSFPIWREIRIRNNGRNGENNVFLCLCEVQVYVDVDECRSRVCNGRGLCNYLLGRSNCQCDDGYTGVRCNSVVFCTPLSAPSQGKLSHQNGIDNRRFSFNSTALMTCNNGYQSDGKTPLRCLATGEWNGSIGRCYDVNECMAVPNVCSSRGNCINSEGSFSCQCYHGYIGNACDRDVDECMIVPNVCSRRGNCTNSEGSFSCQCYDGYTGNVCDRAITCTTISTPSQGKLSYENGIEYMRFSFNSTVLMTCNNGYQSVGNTALRCLASGEWNGTIGRCYDINECRVVPNVCSGRGKCINTEGSFSCQCYAGYTGEQCDTDVDECMLDTNVCRRRGKCINTEGSFSCQCNDGYTGKLCDTEIMCMPIVAPTHGNISYVNEIEGMRNNFNSTVLLTCIIGYHALGDTYLRCGDTGTWSGSLGSCTDVDECMVSTNVCSGHGKCSNSLGSFSCQCYDGYTGKLCDTDIDECRDGDSSCNNNGKCNNMDGTFICNCSMGFTGNKCDKAHNATATPFVLQRSDIECQTTSLKIFVPNVLIPGNGIVTWRDSACVVHSNGTHFVNTIGLRDCGTTLTLRDDSVFFENDLILHKNETHMQNGNNIVTYGSDYEFAIPVKCVYPRNSNISTSFIPIVQQVKIVERRNGQLDLTMRQYEAEDYIHPVPFDAYPRQVPLNNDIFIRINMEKYVTGLGLSADNCFATSTPSPVDPNWYQLISSGCPVNNARIHPSGINDVKFSFHAFNFRHNTSGVVYVHCQVSVCLDTDPACVVGCVTRKKRSASARDAAITSNLISTGPFILTDDEGGVALSTVVAAVSIAVAVIASVVAIIGWTRKSKKLTDS